jgi:hypothetical protein
MRRKGLEEGRMDEGGWGEVLEEGRMDGRGRGGEGLEEGRMDGGKVWKRGGGMRGEEVCGRVDEG